MAFDLKTSPARWAWGAVPLMCLPLGIVMHVLVHADFVGGAPLAGVALKLAVISLPTGMMAWLASTLMVTTWHFDGGARRVRSLLGIPLGTRSWRGEEIREVRVVSGYSRGFGAPGRVLHEVQLVGADGTGHAVASESKESDARCVEARIQGAISALECALGQGAR